MFLKEVRKEKKNANLRNLVSIHIMYSQCCCVLNFKRKINE